MRKAPNNRFSERYPLLNCVTLPQSRKVNDSEQRECKAQFDRLDRILNETVDLLPLAAMYLNSRQHDAPIISTERSSRDFTIWMEDFQVRCLSQVLETMRGVSVHESPTCFPVGFKFCDVSFLSISRINGNDKILPLSVPKYLRQLNEFFYDEVTSVSPDCLSMGMLILTRAFRGSCIDPLLLEVKCRKLEFVEGQYAPFEAHYSDQYPGLYDAFQSERRENWRYFDYSDAQRFVLEEFLRPELG